MFFLTKFKNVLAYLYKQQLYINLFYMINMNNMVIYLSFYPLIF